VVASLSSSSTPAKGGNTLLPPPRLTGDQQGDTLSISRWMSDLYDRMTKAANLIGTQADLVARVAALENDNAALKAEIATLKGA
jgi:hypothetical protein